MIHPHDTGLVIVPAGAGAGKTHRIKTALSDWVKRGVVRPERILAATFTEAAASELRERIRAGLLAEGLVAEALAVERAYVSTIHGLGLRLLTEHALAAGASPQPRHLADAERDLLIRLALSQAKALDPVRADPERFGYAPNFQRGTTVEDGLRSRVLAMIDLLRGLGDTGRDVGLIAPALARLDAVHGPVLADPAAARDTLLAAIRAILDAFPDGGAGGITAKGPRETVEKQDALFQRIVRNPNLLDRDWKVWQSLRKLFASNSSSKTPPGYDMLAEAIMAAADVLPLHPGPLEDAKLHLRCLIACAQEVMQTYEARKKALGLIDYADMITGAERLLRTQPEVRRAVLDEVDCVIIDEFQDTNPVQFALLWQLGAAVPRTLLVGDVKQSIMGFQGADPRLSSALATVRPDALQPLERNWRSTPAVMQFVNALGAGLFGAGYTPLAPTRAPVAGAALEVLNMTKGRGVRNASKPHEHTAERVARILIDREEVTDRHTGDHRPVRPSDVALLVYRHATAVRYAEELRLRGVPVRIAEDGWAAARVVQVARAALSYAANPTDAHAALVLRTLGPDPLPLRDALALRMDARLDEDPLLLHLASLSDALARLPIAAALDRVLAASGLLDWAASQPDPAQARADLLRLEAEAEAFEAAHRDLKAASGFHGATAKVFLGWLDSRSDERDFDRRPDPAADGADAVEIVTWHGSKGREWPITVVAEFDNGIEERAGTTSVAFADLDRIDDMSVVLASAALLHTPGFAAPEPERLFIEDRRSSFEATARNLLYVALTRARDRLVLEWPGFLKERSDDPPKATCLFHVFTDACRAFVRTDAATGAATVMVGGIDCAAAFFQAPEIAGFSQYAVAGNRGHVRFGGEQPMPAITLTPARVQPSLIRPAAPTPTSTGYDLGAPWPKVINSTARGTSLHLALRTYLAHPDLVGRLPAATSLDAATLALVAVRAEELRTWLAAQGYDEFHCEIPISGVTLEGAEMLGTIDLLAGGPAGYLLIDHKSGGAGEGFGAYWAQVAAYADFIPTVFPDRPLHGAAIFWIDSGRLEVADLVTGHVV